MPNRTATHRDEGLDAASPVSPDSELEQVRRAIQGVRFGEVRVIIQDGRVVQIERVEKQRLR